MDVNAHLVAALEGEGIRGTMPVPVVRKEPCG
jgi:hypothetical protein